MTVLVYGADRARRQHARSELMQAGYSVRLASSMAEASKAVAPRDVVLVLVVSPEDGHSENAAAMAASLGVPVVQCADVTDGACSRLVRTMLHAHEASLPVAHSEVSAPGQRVDAQDGDNE